MAWDDRDYSQGGMGGGGPPNSPADQIGKLWRALDRSFSAGSVWGIRIRIHITFVLFAGFRVLDELLNDGEVWWAAGWMGILFGSVLLHEFGHCLACRRTGGRANDILLWPLGGLAYCDPPPTPWAHFVTVVWGPMVNVILAAVSYAVLAVWQGAANPVSFNPFHPFAGAAANVTAVWIAWLFVINYWLLLFNLALVFYPFDGGRLVQIALWSKLGYGRATYLACRIGMVGAVAVAVLGLLGQQMILTFIALFGFAQCWQQNQVLRAQAAYGMASFEPRTYGGGQPVAEQRPSWRDRRAARRRQREQARLDSQEAEIDRILAKVKAQGMQSLTAGEKKMLQRATERQRRGR